MAEIRIGNHSLLHVSLNFLVRAMFIPPVSFYFYNPAIFFSSFDVFALRFLISSAEQNYQFVSVFPELSCSPVQIYFIFGYNHCLYTLHWSDFPFEAWLLLLLPFAAAMASRLLNHEPNGRASLDFQFFHFIERIIHIMIVAYTLPSVKHIFKLERLAPGS